MGQSTQAADGQLPAVERADGQNATVFVHGYLKELILDLVVAPNTLITEMDVARATGLSRIPVREAFLRLHEARLVEISSRRGALVSPTTGVLSFSLDRQRCEKAIVQHREITEALADFDLNSAKAAIERHLVVGERELERLLRH
ncbi:MAG: GntR family transcriptional regulator [Nakamurella sp.]